MFQAGVCLTTSSYSSAQRSFVKTDYQRSTSDSRLMGIVVMLSGKEWNVLVNDRNGEGEEINLSVFVCVCLLSNDWD